MSALTFVPLVRDLVVAGTTVGGVLTYENSRTHWNSTISACMTAAEVPRPYALHKWTLTLREKSKCGTKIQRVMVR